MAAPACPHCRRPLQLEARTCRGCERAVAIDPSTDAFLALDPAGGRWRRADGRPADAQPCGNSRYGACNWLVLDAPASGLCLSCRHNAIIPDLTAPGVLQRWIRMENAKRRAIRGLLRLGLSLAGEPPLSFHLLYDPAAEAGGPPTHPTGYLDGVVTLNLVEADDSARERIRAEMAEPYRTLVGHFRHELGHHFWARLVDGSRHLPAFRDLFGDERADYAAAAQAYYAAGGSDDWSARFVSRYASMHPWEDFAETFAHFLHIVDTLAAIRDFEMTLGPAAEPPAMARQAVDADPYDCETATLAGLWPYFAFTLNAINRSMGQPDVYPFALGPVVVLKLDFINRLVAEAAGRRPFGDGERPGLEAVIAVLGAPADPSDDHPQVRRPAP